jgi:pimeloyl-ACP methyl ester carboxylesterase
MGGLWAIHYALQHPERVGGLVMIGTPAVTLDTGVPKPLRMLATPGIGQLMALHVPSAETMRERLAGLLGGHAIDQLPTDLFAASQLAANIPGASRSFRTLARAVSAAGVAPTSAELASLQPPVIWVWGDADVFADAGFPARARATLPTSEVVVLPGAGHCPWLDDPAAVAAAVCAFLDADGPHRQASASS